MTSSMVRRVQYARKPDGGLVEVERGPHEGFAIGNVVYPTAAEANYAAGRINQQCYIDDQMSEIDYGLSCLVDAASPFASWRRAYDDDERQRDLIDEIRRGLFPDYGWKRSEYAQRFADAFVLANDAYNELHRA